VRKLNKKEMANPAHSVLNSKNAILSEKPEEIADLNFSDLNESEEEDLPKTNLDSLGIIASFICIIHCVGLPLLIPYLSFLAESSHSEETEIFHYIIFPALLIMAGKSIGKGYRVHKNKFPLYLASLGIFLLGSALILGLELDHESTLPIAINIMGSICLITAHSFNLSYSFKQRISKNKVDSSCAHLNCHCKKK